MIQKNESTSDNGISPTPARPYSKHSLEGNVHFSLGEFAMYTKRDEVCGTCLIMRGLPDSAQDQQLCAILCTHIIP